MTMRWGTLTALLLLLAVAGQAASPPAPPWSKIQLQTATTNLDVTGIIIAGTSLSSESYSNRTGGGGVIATLTLNGGGGGLTTNALWSLGNTNWVQWVNFTNIVNSLALVQAQNLGAVTNGGVTLTINGTAYTFQNGSNYSWTVAGGGGTNIIDTLASTLDAGNTALAKQISNVGTLTLADWTNPDPATGFAHTLFNLSGILYWDGVQVWTASGLTNAAQLGGLTAESDPLWAAWTNAALALLRLADGSTLTGLNIVANGGLTNGAFAINGLVVTNGTGNITVGGSGLTSNEWWSLFGGSTTAGVYLTSITYAGILTNTATGGSGIKGLGLASDGSAVSTNGDAIILGRVSQSLGDNSVAIGPYNARAHEGSVAIGIGAGALNPYTIAIGNQAGAAADYLGVIGAFQGAGFSTNIPNAFVIGGFDGVNAAWLTVTGSGLYDRGGTQLMTRATINGQDFGQGSNLTIAGTSQNSFATNALNATNLVGVVKADIVTNSVLIATSNALSAATGLKLDATYTNSTVTGISNGVAVVSGVVTGWTVLATGGDSAFTLTTGGSLSFSDGTTSKIVSNGSSHTVSNTASGLNRFWFQSVVVTAVTTLAGTAVTAVNTINAFTSHDSNSNLYDVAAQGIVVTSGMASNYFHLRGQLYDWFNGATHHRVVLMTNGVIVANLSSGMTQAGAWATAIGFTYDGPLWVGTNKFGIYNSGGVATNVAGLIHIQMENPR